jgi:hypothetical protein
MGWNYIAPYGNGWAPDLITQASDGNNGLIGSPPSTDTPCPTTCQNVSGQINQLEQANPQGVLLLSWSGGAQPINQGAGSGVLNTSGISGIIYLSPGSAAGYAPQLNNIPTFTYWGNGRLNSLVYAANGTMPNGGASTSQYLTLPPGGSAPISNCNHNFGCMFDTGILNSIVSNCNKSSIQNGDDDNQDRERFAVRPEDSEDERGTAEVGAWPVRPHTADDPISDSFFVQ